MKASRRRFTAREILLQGLLAAGVGAFVWYIFANAGDNLARRSITFGFGFLGQTAGFDIPFKIVPWSVTDTYGKALWVCFLNTLLVSALGVVTATILGLALGLMRLSANWLVRNTSLAVVELVRNTPQLLQIVFWYVAVLQALPQARQSLLLPGGIFLNIRGLFVPRPLFGELGEPAGWLVAAALVAVPFAWMLRIGHRRLGPLALILPLAAMAYLWRQLEGFDPPSLQGFNFRGGMVRCV